MNFSFANLIAVASIIPLLFYSLFLLLNNVRKDKSSWYLGFLLLILALFTTHFFLLNFEKKLPKEFVYVYYFGNSLYLLLGPALYSYSKSVYNKKVTLKTEFPHYILFFLSVSYFLILFDKFKEFYYFFRYFQIFIYIILVFALILRSAKTQKEYFSNSTGSEINQFLIILTFFILLWLVDILAIANYFFLDFSKNINLILTYFSLLLTILLPYFLIFQSIKYPNLIADVPIKNYEKNIKIPLEESRIEEYVKQIETDLELKKPFLNPNLTLKDLASIVNISPRLLSQIINSRMNKTFYDLINSYRVEEAKKIISQQNGKNILEICFDVGFNSKSAFNSSFKKFSGYTPTDFKKIKNKY